MIPPEIINNAKRIALISDTHIPSRLKELSAKIHDVFRGVDAIIHTGDFTSREVIMELEAIAPLYGVLGNMDGYEIELPVQKLIMVNGKFLLAACHGAGMHSTTKNRMYEKFKGLNPSAVIYGHTHIASIEKIGNVLMINPGSPSSSEPTVGMLVFKDDTLIPEIIKL